VITVKENSLARSGWNFGGLAVLLQGLRDWWFVFINRKVYATVLKNHEKWRERLNKWAAEFGYAGKDSMEAACMIAKRCAKAEQALRDLAEGRARELANAGMPGLTSAQAERLAWLSEECGAVIWAVGKIQRHGYESVSPFGGPTNRVALERAPSPLRRCDLHTNGAGIHRSVSRNGRTDTANVLKRCRGNHCEQSPLHTCVCHTAGEPDSEECGGAPM
jgi:hypothetical protein